MQTTSDLFSSYFLVRLQPGDSPEPGDNLLDHLSLPLAYSLGHTELLMEGSGGGLSPCCLTPCLKPLFSHQYYSQQWQEKTKVSQDLILRHMKQDRADACRSQVIGWLEISRTALALNYAVSRQLASELKGHTGDRSRCCSCPRCRSLVTRTRV